MNSLRAFVIVTAMSGMAIAGMLTPQAVYAQAVLTAAQETAIEDAVQAAIDEVNAQIFATPEAQEAAMVAAIANVIQAMVNTYGGAAAAAIASIVIATATNAGVSAATIGIGMGTAAAIIEQTNPAAALSIAQTIANEGTEAIAVSFATAATDIGGSVELAAAATGANPTPCVNPSCT